MKRSNRLWNRENFHSMPTVQLLWAETLPGTDKILQAFSEPHSQNSPLLPLTLGNRTVQPRPEACMRAFVYVCVLKWLTSIYLSGGKLPREETHQMNDSSNLRGNRTYSNMAIVTPSLAIKCVYAARAGWDNDRFLCGNSMGFVRLCATRKHSNRSKW